MFYNAVGYAVELRLLNAYPIDWIQRKAPAVAQTVDRRVIVGPAHASKLLGAVAAHSDRGRHLEAFYACLYYAALRPSEAVMLRVTDCHLPSRGWGLIDLAASAPRAGRDWTDDGTPARPGASSTAPSTKPAPSPSCPSWSSCSAPTSSGTAPPRTGGSSPPHAAASPRTAPTAPSGPPPGAAALSPAQHASPLARRPYDLRHAAVSLWLNSGVPATEVARRAGHSVAVLLKIYARIDGQADAANKRIADALGSTQDTPDDQEP